MQFSGNTYDTIFCLDGAVMRAEVSGEADTQTYAVHNHTDETLNRV